MNPKLYENQIPLSISLHALLFSLAWLGFASPSDPIELEYLPTVSRGKVELRIGPKTIKLQARAMQNESTQAQALPEIADPLSAPEVSTGQKNQGQAIQNSFILELRQALEQLKEYPAVARSRRQSGRVEVAFTLTKAGRLTEARIVKPCDFEKLNSAALMTVTRLDHFKPIPDEISKEDWKLVMPIDFRLQ